jgi:hypothetical protein
VAAGGPIRLSGHVTTVDKVGIRGRAGYARTVWVLDDNGTIIARENIDESGRFQTQVPSGRYRFKATIGYRASQHAPETRYATLETGHQLFTQDAAVTIELPRPVVLVHGWMPSPSTWNEWVDATFDLRDAETKEWNGPSINARPVMTQKKTSSRALLT